LLTRKWTGNDKKIKIKAIKQYNGWFKNELIIIINAMNITINGGIG
jgi:hypothetical protein